jgi:D-aminopeptidase
VALRLFPYARQRARTAMTMEVHHCHHGLHATGWQSIVVTNSCLASAKDKKIDW